jgi:hypothetical protein
MRDSTIPLDGQSFDRIRFVNCVIVYRARSAFRLTRCCFENCQFQFEGLAKATAQLLALTGQSAADAAGPSSGVAVRAATHNLGRRDSVN